MLFKGYKFGLMLQLAVGPICLFIFNLGSYSSITVSLTGVLGVALVDAFYILLAIYGIGELIKKEKIRSILKYGGALILILFGIKFIFDGIVSIHAPSTITTDYQVQKVFFESIIFTASNPLTIVVWAGIFASKLSEENIVKKDAYLFGTGLVLSTITFLAGVALIGDITKTFLPQLVVTLLNIAVGIAIIGYGIRQIIKE